MQINEMLAAIVSMYEQAKEEGYTGTAEQYIEHVYKASEKAGGWVQRYDLGPVTAYGEAVAQGFTGSIQEWYQYIKDAAENGQSILDAASLATAAAATARHYAEQTRDDQEGHFVRYDEPTTLLDEEKAQFHANAGVMSSADILSREAWDLKILSQEAHTLLEMGSMERGTITANGWNTTSSSTESYRTAGYIDVSGKKRLRILCMPGARVYVREYVDASQETGHETTDNITNGSLSYDNTAGEGYGYQDVNLHSGTTVIRAYVYKGSGNTEDWTGMEFVLLTEDSVVETGEDVSALKSAYNAYTETLPGKNLLNVTKANSTTNGVVFTNNGDGTITANGTCTAKIQIKFGDCYLHAGKNYILSGLEYASGALQVLDSSNATQYAQQQGGVETTFNVPSDGIYNIRFFLGSGKVINEIIDPMVREAYYLDGTFEQKAKAKTGIAVWIGDSFVQANSLASAGLDQTKRFSTLVSSYFNLTEKNYAIGGMGYITGNTPYSTQLTNAVADHTYDHADVSHVFISGGINDLNTENKDTLLAPAVKSLIDSAFAEYENAKIYIIPLMYYDKNITQDAYWTYKTIANVCTEAKAVLIPNAYTWLNGMAGDILPDGVHPNIAGHALIASHIQNALTTGDSFAYPASCAYSALSSKINTEADNYFCTIKRNSEITVNGIFTLTENATKNERLFEYTGVGKNNPTYIGRYGKHVLAANMNTGATVVLLVTQEDVTEDESIIGYKNYCQAMMAIPAGTWKVVTATLNAGMQEYAGNKS